MRARIFHRLIYIISVAVAENTNNAMRASDFLNNNNN